VDANAALFDWANKSMTPGGVGGQMGGPGLLAPEIRLLDCGRFVEDSNLVARHLQTVTAARPWFLNRGHVDCRRYKALLYCLISSIFKHTQCLILQSELIIQEIQDHGQLSSEMLSNMIVEIVRVVAEVVFFIYDYLRRRRRYLDGRLVGMISLFFLRFHTSDYSPNVLTMLLKE
jgi:hypothetical protein